jgi:hypothetical protein
MTYSSISLSNTAQPVLSELRNEFSCKYRIYIYICFRVIKLRRMRWAGHVAFMRERRGTFRGLVGKREGKRLFGRHRHRWENNIKMEL